MDNKKLAATAMLAFLTTTAGAQQLAFPGAQGWGRFAKGGRYGTVYHVTNLNDKGEGSLRDAVSKPNRIVVFDVSGVINITDRIVFSKNLYVAGQTAPGEGVTVYGNGVSFSDASNIIVRYIRFRMGVKGSSGKDCAGVANGTDMIFDHCSFSWGLDETFSINANMAANGPHNITIMNSIMGQGLLTHSAGGLMQGDSLSLYRNFYCDNGTRNNKVKGTNQFVNNVIYNWKNGGYLMGGDSQGSSYVNVTGNLFINGPASPHAPAISSGNADFHIYAYDNLQDKGCDGVYNPSLIPHSEYGGGPTFADEPFAYPALEAVSATTLIDNLLPDVGASLPYRDMVDAYMVHECKSYGKEGALISNESQLPVGIPSSWSTVNFQKPDDTDGDGMPDDWEKANGTNPNVDDAMTIAANGYANIENYINSLSKDNRPLFLRAPQLVKQTAGTETSVTLDWYDFTEGEDGFALEVLQDGAFKQVARIPANSETYTLSGLASGTKYKMRMRAYKGDAFSAYTDTLNVKTQPLKVEMVDVDNFEPDVVWNGDASGEWNTTAKQWADGKTYKDNDKVLFAPEKETTVSLTQSLSPASVVVNGKGKLAFTDASGCLTGNGSVNKAGSGELVMAADTNKYAGATVLHGGKFTFSHIADGGMPSSLGASLEYAQNWIWDGGTWNYTGKSASTNRNATVYNDTRFDIADGATLSFRGNITGEGGVTLGGGGTLKPASADFFAFSGPLTLTDSVTLQLDYLPGLTDKSVTLGKDGNVVEKLILKGGRLYTKDNKNHYCTYHFPVEVQPTDDDRPSVFYPSAANSYINLEVSGKGTLEYQIPYVREYIKGNWSKFYGRLIAKGMGSTSDGSQLLLNSGFTGFPNNAVTLKGNTRVVLWNPNGAKVKIGGLSGDKGTYLSGVTKSTDNAKITWIVGSANTDEVFNGAIDEQCSARGHYAQTSIEKVGTGDWTLNGNCSYSGTTLVSGGRLIVNGINTGHQGSHTTKGKFTVSEDGTLAGKGSISAPVAINGTLEVTLTGNNSNMTVVTPSFSGAVNIENAVLNLDIDDYEGTFKSGMQIKVLNSVQQATGSGFTTIYPEVPARGLVWDTSRLLTEGILAVADPTRVSNILAGSETGNQPLYDFSGRRVDHPNGPYIRNGKKYLK